jgi:hypothetical protein
VEEGPWPVGSDRRVVDVYVYTAVPPKMLVQKDLDCERSSGNFSVHIHQDSLKDHFNPMSSPTSLCLSLTDCYFFQGTVWGGRSREQMEKASLGGI